MSNQFTISMVFDCDEDWNSMQDEPCGKFCDRCSNRVHDVSSMTPQEARAFFEQQLPKDVCIRLRANAQGHVELSDPRSPWKGGLFVDWLIHKKAALKAASLAGTTILALASNQEHHDTTQYDLTLPEDTSSITVSFDPTPAPSPPPTPKIDVKNLGIKGALGRPYWTSSNSQR